MEFVHRFRDSIAGYLSPTNKRRRTTGPSTPEQDEEPMFEAPTSEPQGGKAQRLIITKVSKTTIIKNPRKRAYAEDEEDTVVTLKPEDSVSQIGVVEGSEEEEDDEEAGSNVTDEDGEEVEGISGSDAEGEKEEEEVEGDSDVEVGDEDDEGELADVDQDSEEIEDDGEEDPDAVLYSGEEAELGSDDEELAAEDDVSVLEENEDDENSDSGIIEIMDDEEEEDIEEDEVAISTKEAAAAEARVQEYLARQAELALRREDIEKAKAAGDWHPDAIILFERLSLRSFEEVLPLEYKIDFPTLPEDIFAPNGVETFVTNNCVQTNSCVRALKGLLGIGIRARETLERTGYPEKFLAKEIKKHIKWSELDGGYQRLRFLPVLVVVAAKPKQATDVLSAAIEAQMKFLAERHREYLALPEERINELGEVEKYKRQPPLLYGMIVARTMVIFVTMDSADSEAKVKHLTHFDFKDKAMDVWNGFAIAYMAIMAKNYIMAFKDEYEEEPEETDPDL